MTQINTSELDNAIQELGSSLSNIINRALTVEDMRMVYMVKGYSGKDKVLLSN